MADDRQIIHRRYFATTNISYILSQMTDVAVRTIKRKFPPDFFKSLTILSEDQAVREQRRLEEKLRTEYQRPNPALSINPNYVIDPSLIEPHEDWQHIARCHSRIWELVGKYQHIFADYDKERVIFTLPKKHKATFDIVIRVESQQKAWDTLSFLKHAFIFDDYFFIDNESMAAILPNVVVAALASDYGYNPFNSLEDRDAFKAILDEHSRTFISDVIDPAKKRKYYVFKFIQNIFTKMSLPTVSYIKKGQEAKIAEIQFSMEMEVSLPTNFATEFTDSRDFNVEVLDQMEQSYYPTVRINAFRIPPLLEYDNKKLVFHKGFITSAPNTSGYTSRVTEDRERAVGEITEELFAGDTNKQVIQPFEILQDSSSDIFSMSEFKQDGPNALADAESVVCQRIQSSNGNWVLRMKLDLGRESEPFTLSAKVASSREEVNVGFKVEGYSGARVRITQPWMLQELELDFAAPKSDPYFYITLPDHEQDTDIYISEISIKRLLKVVYSTSRDDIIYLADVMSEPLVRAIEYSLANNENPSSYLTVYVAEKSLDHTPIPQSDLAIDWENLTVTVTNPLFNTTHYLSIYANLTRLKEILQTLDPTKAASYRAY